MKKEMILSAALVLLMLSLAACKGRNGSGEEGGPAAQWTEGIYMEIAGRDEAMIYLPNTGPCTMYGLTEEMKAVLKPLSTGDVISVKISIIEETYPGNVYPEGVKFIREGEESGIPEGELPHLRAMGHLVIDSSHPLGLPNFEFTLSWGTYGYSSYDSASGKLVKTTDASHPEDYVTTHQLSDEERRLCWQYLMNSNYRAFPLIYDPDPNMECEPPSEFALTVTNEGETKKVSCSDTARDKKTCEPGANDFFNSLQKIAELLMNTEEFQALPDYEHFYE